MGSKDIHLGQKPDPAIVESLADFICGDDTAKYPEYRSSSYLTSFFNDIGINVIHDGSTRKWWVLSVLTDLIPSQVETVILRLVDIREYKGDKTKLRLAFQSMNNILMMGDLAVGFDGRRPFLKQGKPMMFDEDELSASVPEKNETDFLKQQFEDEIDISELGFESQITVVLQNRVEEIRSCPRDKVALGTIFLLGSTLEGILHALAFSQSSKFVASSSAPKEKISKKTIPIERWKLSSLIDVAHDLRYIDLDVKKFSHSLRDFRNYIHPHLQMSHKFNPDQHTADICWQVFKAALAQIKLKLKG